MFRARIILLSSALSAFWSGCSSGDVEEVGAGSVEQTSEAFSEDSCRWGPRDAEWVGRIPTGGYDSPETYSNHYCYKSVITRVTDWYDRIGDLKVTGVTVPSDIVPNAVTCAGLTLTVTMQERTGDWTTLTRSAHGHVALAIVGRFAYQYCVPPEVDFGGATWKTDRTDVDVFGQGATYQIYATYRSPSGATLALHMETPPVTVGNTNQPCVTVGSPHPWCSFFPASPGGNTSDALNTCLNGTCYPCGHLGQLACDSDRTDHSSTKSCLTNKLTPRYQNSDWNSDQCIPCGKENGYCCANPAFQPRDPACEAGLTCQGATQGGTCLPAPMASPPPPQTPAGSMCGGGGQRCCAGDCKYGFACLDGVCSHPNSSSCAYIATLVLDQCFNIDGTPSDILPDNTSDQGCGATPDIAIAEAKAGIGVPLTDGSEPGKCSYTVQ